MINNKKGIQFGCLFYFFLFYSLKYIYFVFQSALVMSEKEHLQSLLEIKNMMNKSTRFMSLSGLSGVLAGIYALIGAFFAYGILNKGVSNDFKYQVKYIAYQEALLLLFIVSAVALLGVCTAIYLSYKKSKKNNEILWNSTSKRLVVNLAIPLIVGALYLLISFFKNQLAEASALMLLFYGLSLINASKFTVGHIKILGFINVGLGLLCHYFSAYSFWFWVLGFGVMHIVYGLIMHYKFERTNGVN